MRRGSPVSDTHPSGTSVLSIFPFIQFDANKRTCKAVQIQAITFRPALVEDAILTNYHPFHGKSLNVHTLIAILLSSPILLSTLIYETDADRLNPIHGGLLLASSFHGKRLLTVSSPRVLPFSVVHTSSLMHFKASKP